MQAKRRKSQTGVKPHPKIKNIIAIASGKGGVGKSTVSTNIAVALHNIGAKTGILDADIYGPSQPLLIGAQAKPEIKNKTFTPIKKHGIYTMSIGYLVDTDAAIAWRGPMAGKALQQLLYDTNWPELDYLIVDLPPGTGDIQLTLSQKIPISGAVVVTTPQDLSLLDAKRAIKMFDKVGITTIGIIENMSYFQCPKCQHLEAIFDDGGGEKLAKEQNIELLGKIPLSTAIRAHADKGEPIVNSEPDNHLAKTYVEIANNIITRLNLQPIDYDGNIPKIIVE